jgi:hypothetical protein
MDPQGEILFYNNYTDDTCDSTFVSNLLVTIQQFTKMVLSSDLKAIGLGDKRYIFMKDTDISLAVRTSKQQVTEQMKEMVHIIRNRFIEKFGRPLKDFSGDATVFNTFEDDLVEILPNKTTTISSQELLKQFFGIKINSKRILEEL